MVEMVEDVDKVVEDVEQVVEEVVVKEELVKEEVVEEVEEVTIADEVPTVGKGASCNQTEFRRGQLAPSGHVRGRRRTRDGTGATGR